MSEWAKVREFATRIEADIVRARLESQDIPVLIKAHEGGMFGAGFQGMSPAGIVLYVPAPLLEEVRELLELDVEPEYVPPVRPSQSTVRWFVVFLVATGMLGGIFARLLSSDYPRWAPILMAATFSAPVVGLLRLWLRSRVSRSRSD